STLKIYGSLTFVAGMSYSFSGAVSFEATVTGQTITSAGQSFSNTVTFNGIGGGWTLQDGLTCTNQISLNNGTLTTNNQSVAGSKFYSMTSTTRALNMGSSVFTLSSLGNFWNVTTGGMSLDAGTSTIN